METKLLEIRDRATFVPVVAIQCNRHNEAERYLLDRTGFGRRPAEQARYVLVSRLVCGLPMEYDPERWNDRTMTTAHRYIIEHWDSLEHGDVVDVRVIRGEAKEPAIAERFV